MNDKLILFCLNEFNPNLLREIIKKVPKSKFLKKILTFDTINLPIQDRYESGYLDPWSQWISVHTGTPTYRHKIKNLGDVPDLKYLKILEILSKKIKRLLFGVP